MKAAVTANPEVVARARRLIGDLPAKRWRDRDAIKDALYDLGTAIHLANGRLPERNRHWQDVAREREGKLVELMDRMEGVNMTGVTANVNNY